MNKIQNTYQQYMYSYPHKTAYRPVAPELVRNHLKGLQGRNAGLYLHLPFCSSKCGYCNLFSVSGCGDDVVDEYLNAVERQLDQFGEILDFGQTAFQSLVLGGGTPVYLSVPQLERGLRMIADKAGVSPDTVDSVIECSPDQCEAEKLRFLKEAGFRRISIGIQSFQDEELRTLGRAHAPQACRKALAEINQHRFQSFNIDLIYGVPGQTEASLRASIREALSFQPTELFLYPLYIKPYTGLYGGAQTDEVHTRALYETARELLQTEGFLQTSMRRFVCGKRRDGILEEPVPEHAEIDLMPESSEIDLPDCGMEWTLALGCGGRSYLGDLHICEPYCVRQKDCRESLSHFLVKEDFCDGMSGFLMSEDEQKRRYAVKNLLSARGVDLMAYRSLFQTDLLEDFPFLNELCQCAMAEESRGRLRLTPSGLGCSDKFGPMFISETAALRTAEFYSSRL